MSCYVFRCYQNKSKAAVSHYEALRLGWVKSMKANRELMPGNFENVNNLYVQESPEASENTIVLFRIDFNAPAPHAPIFSFHNSSPYDPPPKKSKKNKVVTNLVCTNFLRSRAARRAETRNTYKVSTTLSLHTSGVKSVSECSKVWRTVHWQKSCFESDFP